MEQKFIDFIEDCGMVVKDGNLRKVSDRQLKYFAVAVASKTIRWINSKEVLVSNEDIKDIFKDLGVWHEKSNDD